MVYGCVPSCEHCADDLQRLVRPFAPLLKLFAQRLILIVTGNKLYYPDDTIVWDTVILALYMLSEAVGTPLLLHFFRGASANTRACNQLR